jgi:hypothetical protein
MHALHRRGHPTSNAFRQRRIPAGGDRGGVQLLLPVNRARSLRRVAGLRVSRRCRSRRSPGAGRRRSRRAPLRPRPRIVGAGVGQRQHRGHPIESGSDTPRAGGPSLPAAPRSPRIGTRRAQGRRPQPAALRLRTTGGNRISARGGDDTDVEAEPGGGQRVDHRVNEEDVEFAAPQIGHFGAGSHEAASGLPLGEAAALDADDEFGHGRRADSHVLRLCPGRLDGCHTFS